jgi:hypothetical protein
MASYITFPTIIIGPHSSPHILHTILPIFPSECSNHSPSHALIARTHAPSASLGFTQNCPALDVLQTTSSVFSPLLFGIWHTTMKTFGCAIIAPLAHRATVNAGLLITTHQVAATVLSFVFLVFLHYWVSLQVFSYYYSPHFLLS